MDARFLATTYLLLLTIPATALAQEGEGEQRPWGPPPPATEEAEPMAPEEPVPPTPEPQPTVAPTQDAQGDRAPQPENAQPDNSQPADGPAPEGDGQPDGSAPEGDGPDGPAAEEERGFGFQVGRFSLQPFLVLVGGMNYHHIVPRDDPEIPDERQGRFSTVAMTRFGLEGRFGEHVSVRSELELNAGPHGTSVWEGQAAMSVLDQYIRISVGNFQLDVGRITDPASVDYFSTHVANLLLTDDNIRTPFLFSGANRGNGIIARYEFLPGLKFGFTVNAGNPLSYTGTAMFGGTYGIFSRFYTQAQSSVADNPRTLPDDKFYAVLLSPSLTYDWEHLRAQFSVQYMYVDVSRADDDNPHASAFNLRGGIMGQFWSERIRPFFNFSRITNHTFDARGSTPIVDELSQSLFEGVTVSGGIDVDFLGPTGVGIQYNFVREQVGDPNAEVGGPVTLRHYLNVGGSWWFLPFVCLEARYAFHLQCEDLGEGAECGSQNHHNFYLTMRGVFGYSQAQRAAQSM